MTSETKIKKSFLCTICNIDLVDEKNWKVHSAGKKHLQKLHQAELNQRREENGLHITGFPPNITSNSVRGFLRRYGEFTDFYYNESKSFALATFTEKRAAEELLNYPSGVFFNQRKLKISRRRPKPQYPNIEKTSNVQNPGNKSASKELQWPGVNFHKVLDILQPGCSLERLIDELEASPQERTSYGHVLHDLKNLFELRFQHVNIHVFGSTRTGLNLKGSDIDVFMEICQEESSDPALRTPEKLVRIGQRLMLQNPMYFANVRAITRAKTPIIKFVHRPTLVSCDVSFKNMLAVANSELVHFYKNFDRRVYPYFMIIKYWAKIHEFSGCGRMSNYALITIAAFYLQQLDPPVLPTVYLLQKDCPEGRIDGWKCRFRRDNSVIDSTKNTMSLMELLGGFFKYFRDFNIIGQVLCTLTATSIPKASFVQPDSLPEEIRDEYLRGLEERQHGLRISVDMAVQDPFELTHNLTASMGTKALKAFCAHCKLAAQIFDDALKAQCHKGNRYHFLRRLFSEKPKLLPKSTSDGFKMTKTEMTMIFPSEETISAVYLIPDENGIHPGTDMSEEDLFPRWVEIVYQLLLRFFENIMKFQVVEKSPDSQASKVQKIETPSDVHGPSIVKDVYTSCRKILLCQSNHRLWEGRRQAQTNITVPKNVDCFLVEEMITDFMYNAQLQHKDKPEETCIVNFSCEFIPIKEPCDGIKFMFKDTGGQRKGFHSIMGYFRSRVPFLLTKYMKYIKHHPIPPVQADCVDMPLQEPATSS